MNKTEFRKWQMTSKFFLHKTNKNSCSGKYCQNQLFKCWQLIQACNELMFIQEKWLNVYKNSMLCGIWVYCFFPATLPSSSGDFKTIVIAIRVAVKTSSLAAIGEDKMDLSSLKTSIPKELSFLSSLEIPWKILFIGVILIWPDSKLIIEKSFYSRCMSKKISGTYSTSQLFKLMIRVGPNKI